MRYFSIMLLLLLASPCNAQTSCVWQGAVRVCSNGAVNARVGNQRFNFAPSRDSRGHDWRGR
jgi:hypothetical protein